MGLTALGLLSVATGGFGAVLARLNGPVSCAWPAKGAALLQRLRAVRDDRQVGPIRAALGLGLVTALLAGGSLAAYAAQPGAPDQLGKEAIGVVGSGDQLSLRVKAQDGAVRTLKLGDEYREGWKLQALTPAQATLALDGQVRQVGLNPSGAVAGSVQAAPATTVSVLGLPDAATVERYYQMAFARPGKVPATIGHLTPEETIRLIAYQERVSEELRRRQPVVQAGTLPRGMRQTDFIALFGPAGYDEFQALNLKAQGDPATSEIVTAPGVITLNTGGTVWFDPTTTSPETAADAYSLTTLNGAPVGKPQQPAQSSAN